MGQYHKVVNYDKKEFIHPHNIGLGLKQGEQIGDIHATTGDIIFLLLSISNGRGGGDVPTEGIEHLLGRWAGDRVLVVGDYTDPGDVTIEGLDNAATLYGVDEDPEWTDISDEINVMIRKLWGIEVSGGGWHRREVVDHDTYLGPWKKEEDAPTQMSRPDMLIGVPPKPSD